MVRTVTQRVRSASVTVADGIVASIEQGLAILVAIRQGDDEAAVNRVADKISSLRIFEDAAGKMNLSAADVQAEMLVVSQFTLYADARKGRRPSFIDAARPDIGEALYLAFADRLRDHGFTVACGRFGAHMTVTLENDGPVTIILDSAEL